MKKVFVYSGMITGCLLLILAWMLTAVQICVFDQAFYKDQYEKLGLQSYSRLSEQDYQNAVKDLLEYTLGSKQQIDVQGELDGKVQSIFNEKEKAHMADVRFLYDRAMDIRNAAVIIATVLLAFGIFLSAKKTLKRLAASFLIATGAFAAFIGALSIWAAADFNGFWTAFHNVLFTNQLWQLDPATDTMIRMFPQELFSALVAQITAVAAGVAGAVAAGSAVYLCIAKAQEKKKRRQTSVKQES
ncbi:MAG: TIGR01906 family membrane protein [Bacillota bacterium]|nr:TIGR01906 family membrane protein [Bacillota bacterium]